MSPMINVILNPSRPVFDLIGFAGMKLEMLDPPQTTALFSIAQTILITPAHEPKIALINAPPGIFRHPSSLRCRFDGSRLIPSIPSIVLQERASRKS